jgi:hypothetical protein
MVIQDISRLAAMQMVWRLIAVLAEFLAMRISDSLNHFIVDWKTILVGFRTETNLAEKPLTMLRDHTMAIE